MSHSFLTNPGGALFTTRYIYSLGKRCVYSFIQVLFDSTACVQRSSIITDFKEATFIYGIHSV